MQCRFATSSSRSSVTLIPYSESFSRPFSSVGPIRLYARPSMEPDGPIWVNLIVTPAIASHRTLTPSERDSHWCLAWTITHGYDGKPVQRRLHNSEDSAIPPDASCEAFDEYIQKKPTDQVVCQIKKMTFSQRRSLEHIAVNTPVQGSRAHCQDWCMAVMDKACQRGLFTREEVARAKYQASCVPPVAPRLVDYIPRTC